MLKNTLSIIFVILCNSILIAQDHVQENSEIIPKSPSQIKEALLKKLPERYFVTVNGGSFYRQYERGLRYDGIDYKVKLDSYKIGKYEITNELFAEYLNLAVINGNFYVNELIENIDSSYSEIKLVNNVYTPIKGKENYPVKDVTWEGAFYFSEAIGGRLPTEAEWVFAQRGGNKSNGNMYSKNENIDEVAWYKDNSEDATHEVGGKQPNELGIYDMIGNVNEWCSDWLDLEYLKNAEVNNPQGPKEYTIHGKVALGGTWYSSEPDCRPTFRISGYIMDRCGFRVVMPIE